MHTERHTPEDPPALEDLVPATHRLISRLDYETDGIIAALEKSAEVEEPLKKYTAVVKGDFPEKLLMDNIIDAAKRKKVRVTDKKGGYAVLFRKKTAISGYSVVEAELEYAARHQLRAFLAHAGFPIVGDKTYDGEEFPRLLLHCGFTRINGVQEYSKHQDIFLDYFMKHL
jgi:23S rRNA-/tRNA-specific pseudouridylate synthase